MLSMYMWKFVSSSRKEINLLLFMLNLEGNINLNGFFLFKNVNVWLIFSHKWLIWHREFSFEEKSLKPLISEYKPNIYLSC